MRFYFQSFRSGSSGNALLVGTPLTRIIVEFGVRNKRDCRAIIEAIAADAGAVTAVIVSHLHADHLSRYGMDVLAETGIPLCLPERARQAFNPPAGPLRITWYGSAPFMIGDLNVRPIPVSHAPGIPTYGFLITSGNEGAEQHKMGIFTDLGQWDEQLAQHLADCRFIYLECNHDRQLLRMFPNYASRYHLSNPHSALLIQTLIRRSRTPPHSIMLGHLSKERNRPDLALDAVLTMLQSVPAGNRPAMHVAPRNEPSPRIVILP